MNSKLKFGLFTLVVVIFQSTIKLFGVLLTGSLSFLSETADTFTDILFVSITLYSLYTSQKPADYEHMYGHSKIDSISGLIQGVILINIYGLLIYNAIQVVLSNKLKVLNPEVGLIILTISFIVNLVFSRILISEGREQKSLTMEIQGLNLFQDSMRAIIVIFSFIFAYFNIIFLDPILSIILSIWIIIGAFKLAKGGVKDLIDTNPVSAIIIEKLRTEIFAFEHVVGVHNLKVRATGKTLFLEVNLSVEDHISIVHANEIIKSIRNSIYSMKSEYPDIINFKDLNVFRLEDEHFISLIVVINDSLSLTEAHEISSHFESELKKQAPYISRVITHIEGQRYGKAMSSNQIKCADVGPEMLKQIGELIEEVLKKHPQVKGYHGLEFWATLDYCILEMHVFFDGSLNILQIHSYISELEKKIREELGIDNLDTIFLHSEPIEGQTRGIIF